MNKKTKARTKVYSKNEKREIANRCGYEYVYSGKDGRGYFKELEGTQNVKVSGKDSKLLAKLIEQEK